MLRIPNSTSSLNSYSWMYNHFNLVGDFIPNSNGEIHLEPIDIKEVWKEYVEDMTQVNENSVSYIEFVCMWTNCFFHVKIREYKAVTGNI